MKTMKNSKKIIIFKHSSLTDFTGVTRYFCICARVQYVFKGISTITFGYSICTPPDEYNQETAEKIARKKVEFSNRLIAFPGKMINESVLEQILANEIDFVKTHTGVIFKTYADDELKYIKLQKDIKDVKNAINEFNTTKG